MNQDVTLFSSEDAHWFNEGRHYRLWQKLGSHVVDSGSGSGVVFGVWAPAAESVCVIGDFNGWEGGAHRLAARGSSGIWEGFVPELGVGETYKYRILTRVSDTTEAPRPALDTGVMDID